MDNLPMAIPLRYDSPGHVYFIKYHQYRNCYKIGSTGNLFKRLSTLGGKYADIELLAYGFAHDRFWAEKYLQSIFYDHCNNATACSCVRNGRRFNFQFRGDITSTEHFILKPREAQDVITTMKILLPSLQLGTTHPFYCHKWYQPSLEPSDERQYYFDFENERYVRYPTKFENGYPIYEYADVMGVGVEFP